MGYQDPHLSDQELLLTADGELPPKQIARARDHLSACWECRTRMLEMEATIAEVVRLQQDLGSRLPAPEGARAMLRAQMSALASAPAPVSWRGAFRAIGTVRMAAYAAAVFALGFLVAALIHEGSLAGPSGRMSSPSPEARLTPGATLPVTRDQVCSAARQGSVPTVPVSLRQRVFQEYGLRNAPPEAYEVDYLITPELGGASDIRNLWPEPYSTTVWNAHVKDELEDRLHTMVCAGQMDLETAQREIATNWIAAYKKYFHTDTPVSN